RGGAVGPPPPGKRGGGGGGLRAAARPRPRTARLGARRARGAAPRELHGRAAVRGRPPLGGGDRLSPPGPSPPPACAPRSRRSPGPSPPRAPHPRRLAPAGPRARPASPRRDGAPRLHARGRGGRGRRRQRPCRGGVPPEAAHHVGGAGRVPGRRGDAREVDLLLPEARDRPGLLARRSAVGVSGALELVGARLVALLE